MNYKLKPSEIAKKTKAELIEDVRGAKSEMSKMVLSGNPERKSLRRYIARIYTRLSEIATAK